MSILNAETNAGFLIHDISRLMRAWFDERAQKLGVTKAQWRVLVHLAAREGVNQKSLAEILELDTVTLGRHIDRLERDGWIERRPDPTDRRAWLLHMLPAARPILAELEALAEDMMGRALAGMSAEERHAFMSALTQLKTNLVNESTPTLESVESNG